MEMRILSFIQDLTVILLISGIITVLFHRFKQPVVLGYILAGIIIGPYTPPFSLIYNPITIKILAELGIIFLMFSLGMEFDLHKLKKVGLVAFVAAFTEIILMIWIGYEIGLMFKWSPIDSIFLGAILAISSTTIIVKALEDLNLKQEKFAQLVFGILIIEDIFAIAILAVLSGVAISGAFHFQAILVTTLKLSSFLIISLIIGILLIPRLLGYIAKFKNNEMLLISILGICFGFCLLVLKLDYSVALGAFLIGAIVAESAHLKLIEQLIYPLRTMFSAIFFVSVGLMFDPKVLIKYAMPIFVITIAVVVGKVFTSSISTFLAGKDAKTSMKVGMSLAQIGEFSFIIAAMGLTLKVTSDFLFPIAIAVSAITTFLTPYLIKYSDAFTITLELIMPNRVCNIFRWYTAHLESNRFRKTQTATKKAIQRHILHVIINFFIITAIFFAGAYIAKTSWGITLLNTPKQIQKTIIWSAVMILSLPFLLVVYNKTKQLSIILARLSIRKSSDQNSIIALRKIISEVIPVLSLIGILLFVSTLSAIILPPVEPLVFVMIILFVLIIFLYSWCLKVYAKMHLKFLASIKKSKDFKK